MMSDTISQLMNTLSTRPNVVHIRAELALEELAQDQPFDPTGVIASTALQELNQLREESSRSINIWSSLSMLCIGYGFGLLTTGMWRNSIAVLAIGLTTCAMSLFKPRNR